MRRGAKYGMEKRAASPGNYGYSVDSGVGSISSVLSYIQTFDVGGKEAEVRYAAWVLVLVLVFRVKRLGREGYICRRALPDGVWIFLGKDRNGKANRRCGLG